MTTVYLRINANRPPPHGTVLWLPMIEGATAFKSMAEAEEFLDQVVNATGIRSQGGHFYVVKESILPIVDPASEAAVKGPRMADRPQITLVIGKGSNAKKIGTVNTDAYGVTTFSPEAGLTLTAEEEIVAAGFVKKITAARR